MACTGNRTFTKLIEYCKECGIEVKTSTKARGHQGVFLHNNYDLRRIDISKNLSPQKAVPVIAHEFTHFFHHSIDSSFGSLEKIFGVKDEILLDELAAVTEFVTGRFTELNVRQELLKIKSQIKEQENIIKSMKLVRRFIMMQQIHITFTASKKYLKSLISQISCSEIFT